MKIGITGQNGFLGTHLYNSLHLDFEKFAIIPFNDEYFVNQTELECWVSKCDVIVHLAAVNRHHDVNFIYQKNISLVEQLIAACEHTNSKPHIFFSSSIQEDRDNPYGRSKKDGRILFENWAKRNCAKFTGLIIPNVFGPFCNPFYNSAVATFCYQLTHNETPKIEIDSEIKLIYVSELVNEIIKQIELTHFDTQNKCYVKTILIPYTFLIKVSDLLSILKKYKNQYFENGEIPFINTPFELNLFNTFITYINYSTFFPFNLNMNTDQRGSFVEIIKLHSGGQISFSTTLPGVIRGNHFHTRKAERFAVIKGKARIKLRRIGTDKIFIFELDGKQPSFVDIPIWYTHNITNIGDEELLTVFWINEIFNPKDADTYAEQL